jgi:hypothetical protein
MPVYEYEGKHYELPDGLSNEQAIQKIESHLGKTPAPEAKQGLERGVGLAARAVLQGSSSIPNAVGDAAAAGINNYNNMLRPVSRSLVRNILGDTIGDALDFGAGPKLPSLSQVQQQGMAGLGLPKPETGMEKALSAGLEAASGGATVNLAAAPFKAANPLMTKTAGEAASLVAGGAVAPGAYEVAKDWTGSDLAATALSLLASATVGSASGKIVDGATAPKTTPIKLEDVEKRAKAAYSVVDSSGVALKPASAQSMVNRIEAELRANNYRPAVQPRVKTVLNQLREDIGTQRVSFAQMEQLRGVANALKTDPDKDVQRLGAVLIREFDNQVAGVSQKDLMLGSGADFKKAVDAVESARKDWRALSKASLLEEVLDVAEIRKNKPAASESELIRDGFMRIATNKNKMRQFSSDEQKAILEVSRGIPLDSTLGQLARLNPARSQLALGVQGSGAAGAFATGNPTLGAAAIASGAAGFTADKVQGVLRRRQAEKAIQRILGDKSVSEDDIHSLRGLFGGVIGGQE